MKTGNNESKNMAEFPPLGNTLSDDMRCALEHIKSETFKIKEHGFKFKDLKPLDPARQIKDLWAFLKKLRNLKDSSPKPDELFDESDPVSEQATILMDLRRYLDSNWNSATTIYYGYPILSRSLAIFEILGWAKDPTGRGDPLEKINKSARPNQADFARHMAVFVLHFRFDRAIDELEKVTKVTDQTKLAEIEKIQNMKELRFILDHLKLFREFFDRPQHDLASFEYRILCTAVQSVELETPYWRMIQTFLSKSFQLQKNQGAVMNMPGINFFDRLLFVLRFQTSQAYNLIDGYAKKGRMDGVLDAISLWTGNKADVITILDKYGKQTSDIITVGLAAILLETLYGWNELLDYVEAMMIFLDAQDPTYRQKIEKEMLSMRQEIKQDPGKDKKAGPSLILACYYCKKDPRRQADSDDRGKSVRDITRRKGQECQFG